MYDWGHTTRWIWKVRWSYQRRVGSLCSANRDFRLTKTSGWDSVALERIEESTKEGRGAEVGAVVCGEGECRCTEIICDKADCRNRCDLSVE